MHVSLTLSLSRSHTHSTIQYLGFGLSGSPSATSMFQADATIAWIDRNGMAQAQDYYLSGYVQVCLVITHIRVQWNYCLFSTLSVVVVKGRVLIQ